MEGFSDLERSVLDKALSADDPVLATLREQARSVRVTEREFTGVGFFLTLAVADDAPRAEPRNFEIADVWAEIEGLEHGAVFVLFIRDGRLEMLEGVTIDEPWPERVDAYRLSFDNEPRNIEFDRSGGARSVKDSAKTLEDVPDAIVRMPLDRRDDVSSIDLIERAGYLPRRGEVSVDDLYRRLAKDPELVEAWQVWVDDNRGSPAWYFRSVGPGQFEIGYIDGRLQTTRRQIFDDRARACAEYVHREIEQLAETAELWRRPWRLVPKVISWFVDGLRR